MRVLKEPKELKVCAGIVTYNPDIEQFKECFNSLKDQVDFIYIVDNASENKVAIERIVIESVTTADRSGNRSGIDTNEVDSVDIVTNANDSDNYNENNINTHIQFNDENLGIATALNQLCKKAYDDGYQWILTMDQDSICCDSMVKKLVAYAAGVSDIANNVDTTDTAGTCDRNINQTPKRTAIGTTVKKQRTAREMCTTIPRYGIIAPRVEFWKDGILITSTKKLSESPEKIRACITSGSLTNLEAWKDIGGFDDWMFIDHVDNEFCTHLWKEGYEVVRVHEAVLYQRAGEMKFKRIFGKNILLPHYSEKRNYYICRNTVYFLRKYRHDINFNHELLAFIYSICIKILFEKGRYGTLKSACKGIRDAFRKRI